MGDSTLYDTTLPSAGSVALAHERLLRLKTGGAFVNITGDINNLSLGPSPITVPREVYGQKGRTSQNVVGYNFAPTFDVEVIRDPVTKQVVAAQAWLIDLLAAAYETGGANKREFQIITDAFDERFPAFQGSFSVTVAEANTGFADKNVLRFTLQNDGETGILPVSPIAGTGVPVIETMAPAGVAIGSIVAIRGVAFTGATAVKFGSTAAPTFRASDDTTIAVTIPAGATGVQAVTVTNAKGKSTAYSYTVGA